MPDISILWQVAAGRGDWAIVPPDLQTGDDLVTAVLVSLFTDGEARDGDRIPDGSGDRRGWWGSVYLPSPVGSRLWTLARSKETEAVRLAAQDMAIEALQWLVTSGVASAVDVQASWVKPGWLGLVVTVSEPSGRQTPISFQWAWSSI